MSFARGLASTLCAIAGALAIATALAQGAPRVVLLAPSAGDPIAYRLRRELELLGVEVDLVIDPGGASRDLAAVVQEHHAAAAVVVEAQPPSILLFTDPTQRPLGAASPKIRVDAEGSDPRLPVLRAVETLRERLLAPPPPPSAAPSASSAAPPPPPAPPSAAPSASAAPARTATPMLRGPSGFAGAAVLLSPGGVGATPHVWLGARWAPSTHLDLELVGLVPTTGATVTANEGSMTVRAGVLGVGAAVRIGDPAGFFGSAGAGFGALLTAFDGQAAAPYKGASGLRASMFPYAHAATGYWLASHVALRADVMAGFALPEPVLTIAGQRVGFFAEPAVTLAGAIEVRP